MVIKKSESAIILTDETKVTKFVLIDAVGDDAAELGVKVGDIALPIALANIVINGGRSFRPTLEEKDIAFFVTDMSLSELVVQTDNGKQYVPFDAPDAAQPLGAPAVERKSEAA
jgi:energy-converting hydrogenase Eha subunit G